MKLFKKIADIQSWSEKIHKKGKDIALVPTMGCFHKGHLSLMKKGKELCSHVVVSLFVNPTQFGKNEDFNSYPANIKKDIKLAKEMNISAIFLPDNKEIYPEKFQTYVKLTHLPSYLCGITRQKHFKGVTTIITKLFNIIKPDKAIFGSKDFQQVQIIRQMTHDLNYNIEIVECPTVREKDNLAMSSRNIYLTSEQRESALSLSKALKKAEEMIVKEKNLNGDNIKNEIKKYINSFPFTEIDYIALCEPETLKNVINIKKSVLFALAIKIGKTRLIDNIIIDPTK